MATERQILIKAIALAAREIRRRAVKDFYQELNERRYEIKRKAIDWLEKPDVKVDFIKRATEEVQKSEERAAWRAQHMKAKPKVSAIPQRKAQS